MLLASRRNRCIVLLWVVLVSMIVSGSRAHRYRWLLSMEELGDDHGSSASPSLDDLLAQTSYSQSKSTEAEILSSRHPGSRPPQCQNVCGGSCHGRCIARPRFLQGGRAFGQHAVWTCSCQDLG
ncbi:uncharacterized protein LOC112351269 [Selaginella moellendorffii]|uniref:uncharacterized protein LOC112351269 n=1 Tax=Selaginella moellendorffii TaxID=88036 RepID=UPI000D1D0AEA|nr:uncharacterized protein LOC112351269 [Selaginella moellendorffii]|eukprot:XP_024544562.1 uncharacterized protein LOC112351269 [Selaginella moellendorffii]